MNRRTALRRRPNPSDHVHTSATGEVHPSTGLSYGLSAASRFLDLIGPDRIELVTVTGNRVSLQPADLNQGEQLAQVLGLNIPVDHRMFVPGNTLWTGERDGLEVQVRSALRQVVAR